MSRHNSITVWGHFFVLVFSALIALTVNIDPIVATTTLSSNGSSIELAGFTGAFVATLMKWFIVCGAFEFVICIGKCIVGFVSFLWKLLKK